MTPSNPSSNGLGGKGQLLGVIRSNYPPELGKSIRKYAEPFVGGGAVLFDILSTYDLDEVYISDVNAELVNVYSAVRDNISDLVNALAQIQAEYIPLNSEARKAYFYDKRRCFNQLKLYGYNTDSVELASLFLFLNKTCFNGLYRVNSKGLYNVPSGVYKNPCILDEPNLRAVSATLQKVNIVCGSYDKSEAFIDANTFVYFDPPYRPLTATAFFTSYTKDCFNDKDQTALARYVDRLHACGAKVMVSNSDPKNVDPADDFFDQLYRPYHIHRIKASRMINSKGSGRGKVDELLVTTY